MELGISPIVTSGLIMQVCVFSETNGKCHYVVNSFLFYCESGLCNVLPLPKFYLLFA